MENYNQQVEKKHENWKTSFLDSNEIIKNKTILLKLIK